MSMSPPPSLPSVTPRGVTLATRGLFALLGALLGPLIAQYLFGPQASPREWGLVLFVTPLFALWPARWVSRGAVGRVLFASLGAGTLNGVICALLWNGFSQSHPSGMFPVAALFGAIYGFAMSLGFAAVYALWARLARNGLTLPSTLGNLRLAVHAGLLLTLAGTAAGFGYRISALQQFGAAVALGGLLLSISTLFRLRGVWGVLAEAGKAYPLVAFGASTQAPVLAHVGTLDHVLVLNPDGLEAAPFREVPAAYHIARVPSDLGGVRQAFAGLVYYALGAVVLGSVLTVGTFAQPMLHCP
ncbi:MAG: hypothetical protein HY909_11300 [Deltaproteobacteria bacterium]|nr:hypothetical protein [Deltaproteobacteria bacterium]